TRIRKPAFFCTALDSIRFVLVCNGFPPRCARACLFQVRLWHAHIQGVKRRPVVALRDPYSVCFVVTFAARTLRRFGQEGRAWGRVGLALSRADFSTREFPASFALPIHRRRADPSF